MSPAQRLPVLILEPPRAVAGSQPVSAEGARDRHHAGIPGGRAAGRNGLEHRSRSPPGRDPERHGGAELGRRSSSASSRKGGGLFVVLGERANWGTDSNDLLPGVPGNVVDRPGRGGALAELDYSHPVLEMFKAPRSGNLSTARFFRYRAHHDEAGAAAATKKASRRRRSRVIARFDDGAVAMAERTIGSGQVMLWTSTLDNYWNDLALQAGVSAVRARGRCGTSRPTKSRRTGSRSAAWSIPAICCGRPASACRAGTGAMVLTPAGQRIEQSGTPTPVQLDEPGFYEVHGRSNQAGHGHRRVEPRHGRIGSRRCSTRRSSARLWPARPGSDEPGSRGRRGDDAGRSGAAPEFLVVSADGRHRAARHRNGDLEPHEGPRRRHADHSDRDRLTRTFTAIRRAWLSHERRAHVISSPNSFSRRSAPASTRLAAVRRPTSSPRLDGTRPARPDDLADRWVNELDRHGVRARRADRERARRRRVGRARGRASSVAVRRVLHARPDGAGRGGRGDARARRVRLRTHMPVPRDAALFAARSASYERSSRSRRTRPGTAVFVHCGALSVGVRKKLGLPSRFDVRHGNPLDVQALAAEFPARAVHHSALRRRASSRGAARRRTCARTCISTPRARTDGWRTTLALTLADVFRQALKVAGPDRLLFGTDSSFFPRGWNREIYDAQLGALDAGRCRRQRPEAHFRGQFRPIVPRVNRLLTAPFGATMRLILGRQLWLTNRCPPTDRS